MKIVIDPLPAMKASAKERLDRRFNEIAASTMHIDYAHDQKRIIAARVGGGESATAEFASEADLRGVTAQDLAATILTKPNNAALRELRRQTTIAVIEAATSIDEIERALNSAVV